MATYLQVLIYSFVGSMFAFSGACLLIAQKTSAKTLASYVTPFAAGALLAAVFFDLIPESINESSVNMAMVSTLSGLIIFFYLERFLRWFHHHHEHQDSKDIAPKSLIVIGDLIHNSLDGVVVAAGFLVSVPAGIIAVFAIAAHEIPQEIGNIGLLLGRGMSKKYAMLVNGLSVVSTVLTALIVFTLGSVNDLPLGVLLGISAGFLLYIATSDVIPLVHKQSTAKKLYDLKPFLLIVGVLVVGLVIYISRNLTI